MNLLLSKINPQFAVVGGGSWATALVNLLSGNGREIRWYVRRKEVIDYVLKYGHHPSYIPAAELDTRRIYMSNDINEVISDADIVIFAVPSAYFIDEIKKINVSYENKLLLSAVKGFVSDEHLTVAEYFHRVHNIPFDRLGVISGPCHAEEVAMNRLSYITISSKYNNVSSYVCQFFKNYFIHTISGTDIYGVEYAAALKNVYAVAAGICHGLGYGDNFMAVLITNSFNEMKDFINFTHPDKRTTTSSAYLGDLLVTCYSQFSRNRTFGGMIGKGYSVNAAQIEMKQVAEGYFATKSIFEINKKLKMKMPVAEAVYSILYDNKVASAVMKELTNKLK
jgi:glycerol-3-phosphate dehydrogenase (NAD(P)+)